MTLRHLLNAILLASTAAAHGQISVEILNMPKEVHSFGPVYVLHSVENVGREPVYVPNPIASLDIYVAPAGETPRRPRGPVAEYVYDHPRTTMWLAPGERWLFYRDISFVLRVLEGDVAVQVGLWSAGRCGDELAGGRHSFPMEPLFLEEVRAGASRVDVYRCWEGEAKSSVLDVSVKQPHTEIDQKAFEYLLQNRGLAHDPESDTWELSSSAARVRALYPESHYAYASWTRSRYSAFALKQAVESQPDNPLNPWVMGAIARHVLDSRSSCWDKEPLDFDLDIGKLELPDGVHEYLDQYAWYLENRHCPLVRRREAEEKAKGPS